MWADCPPSADVLLARLTNVPTSRSGGRPRGAARRGGAHRMGLTDTPIRISRQQRRGGREDHRNAGGVSGAPDSALATLRPGTAFASTGIRLFTLAAAGRWSDAEHLRDRIIAQSARRRGWNPDAWFLATAFGKYETAMDLLEAGWNDVSLGATISSVSGGPLIQPLRTNPRFIALLDRGGITRCPGAATAQ